MFRNNEVLVDIVDVNAVSEKELHIQLIGYDSCHRINYEGEVSIFNGMLQGDLINPRKSPISKKAIMEIRYKVLNLSNKH